jgi:hypothetical protein
MKASFPPPIIPIRSFLIINNFFKIIFNKYTG